MVSIRDVAREAGVSIGTVSNVINNKKNVSLEIRERVNRAIKKLGYVPKVSARNLKLGVSNIIGVILPTLTDRYFSRIYTGLQNILIPHGYNICLTSTNEIASIEEEALYNMVGQRVAGIVLITCNPMDPLGSITPVKDRNIPLVTIDRKLAVDYGNFISFNYEEIGEKLCNEILLRNYKRPVILTGPINYSSERNFIEGFNKCYHRSGKIFKNLYIFQTCLHKFCSFKLMANFFSDLDDDRYPDVIITTSEILSDGVFEAVEITNRNKKREVDVISLTEQNWLEMINPKSIGAVFRPAFKLGEKAGELLLDNIKSVKIYTPKRVILSVGGNSFENELKGGKFPSSFSSKLLSKNLVVKNKSLNVYMLKDLSARAIIALLNDYNGNEGEINIYQFDYDDLYDAINSSIGKKEPDVFMVDIPWIPYLASKEILYDITGFVKEDSSFLEGYIPEIAELYSKYGDRYFALPFNFSVQILFYRKDLFDDPHLQRQFMERYGIELVPPKTWDEYNAIAEFFTKKYNPDSPIEYGNTVGGASTSNVEYLPRLWAYGGQVFDESGNVVVNSYQGLVALKNYIKSYDYAIPNSIGYWWWHQIDAFAKGKAAMMVMYVNHTGNLVDRGYSEVVGKFGVASIPGRIPALGGWSLGINRNSEKIEESYRFIKWASSSRIAVPFTVLGGCTTRSMIEQAEELLDLYPYLKLAENNFKYSRKRTYALDNLIGFGLDEKEYDSIMSRYISRAVMGEMDHERALDEMSKAIEQKVSSSRNLY